MNILNLITQSIFIVWLLYSVLNGVMDFFVDAARDNIGNRQEKQDSFYAKVSFGTAKAMGFTFCVLFTSGVIAFMAWLFPVFD